MPEQGSKGCWAKQRAFTAPMTAMYLLYGGVAVELCANSGSPIGSLPHPFHRHLADLRRVQPDKVIEDNQSAHPGTSW